MPPEMAEETFPSCLQQKQGNNRWNVAKQESEAAYVDSAFEGL